MFDVGYYYEPTTPRAHHAAIMFVCDLGKRDDLPKPYLLHLPDGGLALKWDFENGYVAVNFDEAEDYLDNVLVNHGEHFCCEELTMATFQRAINEASAAVKGDENMHENCKVQVKASL